jgi:nuclear RNA export factor
VEDQTAAKALKDLDRRIELPDGPQLVINLDRSTPPNVTLSEDLVNKMMLVMSKRYNAQNKALNLKAFHTDDDFLGDSFFAPLWRSNVMAKVLTIIGDQIPETTAIDLGDNKLLNLDNMNLLKQKAPNVNILHLANNRLREARTLDKIKDLKLIELKLVGNPIVEKLDTSYVSVVRKMFPTLQFLDDKELPKEIGFDVESEADPSLPETIPKLIKNEAAGAVVLQFLHQFFTLYDSDSRQPLLDAYHEHAMMSMACVGPFESLKAYITESRNLTRISDSRQHKLLHRGRLQVVSFLSSLPKTQHDPTTFTLDVPFTSEKLMTFTVTGMFKEREAKNAKIMHFNRCFVVVPHGTGFCIVNEILFISFAQPGNAKKAFTSPDSQLAAPAPAAAAPAPAAYPAVPAQLGVEAKRTMATAFAEKSGMNVEWSVKCLEENTWDFDKSAVVFAELKNQGKIPPEAFVK